jgi:outer membrane protein assembly factor BamB
VAADGRNVVVFFPDFGLINYTLDGKEQWRVPLGPFDNLYGMGASPVLAGDRVVLVCDQSHNSFIAAFATRNGEQMWRTSRPEAQSGHSTPVLYKNWIIAPGSFRMDAYDLVTGKSAWGVDGLPGEMKSVPVIDGGMLYIHGFNTPENDPGRMISVPEFEDAIREKDTDKNGRISLAEAPTKHVERLFKYLDLNGDGEMDREEWQAYKRTMLAENALLAYRIGGGLVWKFQRSIPQLPSPLVYRGVLYMINEAGVLTTLDARTGSLHKQARLRGESDRYYSSPVAADGKVYLASHTGMVSVLRAGPEQELLSANHVEDEVLATPALVDGRVYLRTASGLWCFGQ